MHIWIHIKVYDISYVRVQVITAKDHKGTQGTSEWTMLRHEDCRGIQKDEYFPKIIQINSKKNHRINT